MLEKYTVSCNNLPKYEAATPLVKFLECRSGSFSYKHNKEMLEAIEDIEMSVNSTQSNSISSTN